MRTHKVAGIALAKPVAAGEAPCHVARPPHLHCVQEPAAGEDIGALRGSAYVARDGDISTNHLRAEVLTCWVPLTAAHPAAAQQAGRPAGSRDQQCTACSRRSPSELAQTKNLHHCKRDVCACPHGNPHQPTPTSLSPGLCCLTTTRRSSPSSAGTSSCSVWCEPRAKPAQGREMAAMVRGPGSRRAAACSPSLAVGAAAGRGAL